MRQILELVDAAYRRRAPLTVVSISIAAIAAIAALEALVNPQVGLLLVYLLPVGLASFYAPPWVSRLVCVAAAIAAYLAFHLGDVVHDSPWITIWNLAARLVVFVAFSELVHALRRALEREQALARTDPLTGVLNSRAFDELCAAELERVARFGDVFSLALVDLDDFKTINDTRGHAAGDEVLRSITAEMRSSVRKSDVIARIGGDEFVALLPQTDVDAATVVVEHLIDVVSNADNDHDGVSASTGVVTVRGGTETVDSLLLLADELLYEAKSRGKGSVARRVVDGNGGAERHGHVDLAG